MIRSTLLIVAVVLAASPAAAADMDAAAITKAIDAVAADATKTKAYCDMAAKFDEIGDDEKKAEAAGDEIDGYFKTLGPDFESAWDAGQNAEDNSAEANAFGEAMDKLDSKCAPPAGDGADKK